MLLIKSLVGYLGEKYQPRLLSSCFWNWPTHHRLKSVILISSCPACLNAALLEAYFSAINTATHNTKQLDQSWGYTLLHHNCPSGFQDKYPVFLEKLWKGTNWVWGQFSIRVVFVTSCISGQERFHSFLCKAACCWICFNNGLLYRTVSSWPVLKKTHTLWKHPAS